MNNFWEKLPRPFYVLAPLANVTDVAFRRLIATYGKPDVFYTEFVSADGLCSVGREILQYDLKFSEAEHPIVAQFFTSKPENMEKVARMAVALGFNGVDINMGCPDRSIEKQGAGAALIKNPKLAQEIIAAAKQGAGDLPVSVKTRIGYNKNEIETWLPNLLETKPAAIVVHARTRKEMSTVAAHWDVVAHAVEVARGSGTFIVGNGDVLDIEDAKQKALETGADGIMLGRAIFGNPWLFRTPPYIPSVEEKLAVMLEHTQLFIELLGGIKSFALMKKHFKAYANGFDKARELRVVLMEAEEVKELETIIDSFLEKRRALSKAAKFEVV